MIKNIANSLLPYFAGDKQFDEAISDVCKLFIRTFEDETFICKGCGEIISPKVTANEHGIFIESNRAEVREGKGNYCIEKDVCEERLKKVSLIRR